MENGVSFNSVFGPMDINMAQTDNYIDSGLAAYSNTEPQPGFTSLSNLSINMVTGEVDIVVHDIAFYLVVEASLTPGLPLPGIVQIYEKDGAPANSFTAGDTYSLTPEYPYKSFSVFYPELVNYDSSGLFFSSTIFQGPDLENGAVYNYASDYYNVSYGIAFDSTFLFAAYDLIFEWDLTPGLAFDDLDFKVVYIEGATLQDDEWDTVAEVNALNPTIHIDWADDCSIYYGTVSNPDGFYDITGSTMLSNLYAVILAKFPGGEEFIYAKQFSN